MLMPTPLIIRIQRDYGPLVDSSLDSLFARSSEGLLEALYQRGTVEVSGKVSLGELPRALWDSCLSHCLVGYLRQGLRSWVFGRPHSSAASLPARSSMVPRHG